ncbi:hypothetical protein [Candidatus Ichthyocystis hellenicum]|uniref:hypothetical protein n=1 Tax=Candidatus Ichthyocystis hellenicum TaxID=1561003 RepID=UPI000B82AEE1|nr:hypothetical protein [Candidatus Ichthyocystis hellenicum]
MNTISTIAPPPLIELSSRAIWSLSCKQSISQLRQLSTEEIIRSSALIRRKQLNLSRYASYLHLESDDGCRFFYEDWNKITIGECRNSSNYKELRAVKECSNSINVIINSFRGIFLDDLPANDPYWKNHPVYQVIYNENSTDIIKNYRERRNEILSLPDFPGSVENKSCTTERISYYYDPLFFLKKTCLHNKDDFSPSRIRCLLKNTIVLTLEPCFTRRFYTLKKNACLLRRPLSTLVMALTLQIEDSISLLEKSLSKKDYTRGREISIMESLNAIIIFKKLCVNIKELRSITPIMELSNFVPLEDRVEIFKKRVLVSNPCSNSVNRLYLHSSLILLEKTRYYLKSIVTRKKVRIKYLLEKINLGNEYKMDENFFEPVFMESAENLLKKIKLSREPESEERDEKLLNPALIDSANYLLEKINPGEESRSNENSIESVFIESIIESVIKIRLEVSGMEKFLSCDQNNS